MISTNFKLADYKKTVVLGALLIYSSLLLLPLLGFSYVYQVSEGREGVVVNEILSSGEFILPLRNGEIVPSKPILFHWISAGLATLVGSYDEFGLRLPSALSALLLLAAMFFSCYNLAGTLAGTIGFLLLFTQYGFFRLAQDGRVDMLFATFFSISMLIFINHATKKYFNLTEISRRTYLMIGAICGFAMLTKGPLGIVAPFLLISSIQLFLGGIKPFVIFLKRSFWGWLVAVAIPLPWYIAAAQIGEGSFFSRQLIFENLSRFLGAEGITSKPPWFYFQHLFTQPLPWSPFLLGYFFFLARGFVDYKKGLTAFNRFLPEQGKQRFAMKAALIWFFVLFVFLSISAGKRRAYLLMLLPAVSLILTIRIVASLEKLRDSSLTTYLTYLIGRFIQPIIIILALILSLPGLLIFTDGLVPESLYQKFPQLTDQLIYLTLAINRGGITLKLFFIVIFSLMVAAIISAVRKRQVAFLLIAFLLQLNLCYFVYLNLWDAKKGFTHSYKQFAREVSSNTPYDTKITFIKTKKDESFDGFFFYFKRHVKMIDPKSSLDNIFDQTDNETPNRYYIARKLWLHSLPEQIKARTKIIISGGKKKDKDYEKLVLFTFS
jgi:4-amino-4-deoxy-L-arabinose transferase-like glycosyltransferase